MSIVVSGVFFNPLIKLEATVIDCDMFQHIDMLVLSFF